MPKNRKEEISLSWFAKWGEWLVRIAMIALLCGNLWMKQNFVSADVYSKDKEAQSIQMTSITKSINDIATAIALLRQAEKENDRQDIKIADLDTRVRDLEKSVIRSAQRLETLEGAK